MTAEADLRKAQEFLSSDEAKVLLLNCIDHRIQAQIPALMKSLGYDVGKKEYDQIVLPGASLAAVLDFGPDQKPHWKQTFYETLYLAINAHNINGLVIIDHTDCGAYKRYWDSMGVGPYEPGKEPERHEFYMNRLANEVREELKTLRPKFVVLHALLQTTKERGAPEKMLEGARIRML